MIGSDIVMKIMHCHVVPYEFRLLPDFSPPVTDGRVMVHD